MSDPPPDAQSGSTPADAQIGPPPAAQGGFEGDWTEFNWPSPTPAPAAPSSPERQSSEGQSPERQSPGDASPPAPPLYPTGAPAPPAPSPYPSPVGQPPPRAIQGTLASSQPPAEPYQPPPGYGPAGYWTPGGPGQWRNRAFGRLAPPAGSVNGMAIAALVLGLVGWVFFGFGSFLAVVFGITALRQLRAADQRGRGLAIAGIVLGSVAIVITVVALAAGRIVR